MTAAGTFQDKVSAMTLLVQESPIHNMKGLEDLLNLSRKSSREQALMALTALKDLLAQGVVLPGDRKLRTFVKQPALASALEGKKVRWSPGDPLPGGIQKAHLILWAYEDWLKKQYFEVLKLLERWGNDEIQYARMRSIGMVWELLKEKPEQEENLLRLLVNKLGDRDRKVAARTSHLLLQLQEAHPMMKNIIIDSIKKDLILRPGQSLHAKYYAIVTLNQTVLSSKEAEVANKLLDIYFDLFMSSLRSEDADVHQKGHVKFEEEKTHGGGKPGKMAKEKARKAAKRKAEAEQSENDFKEKMIAQILTGTIRAFPFAETDDDKFERQIDTIFRITHSANFNSAIRALMFLQQVSVSKPMIADRFYRTLYESLLDPRLVSSSKQIMYLNLLYRSLKSDASTKRVQAFVKRLLQALTLHEAPFICGVLYLISELRTSFPSIQIMIDHPEQDPEDDEEHFRDAPDADTASMPNGNVHVSRSTAIGSPDGMSTKTTGTAVATEASITRYDPRRRHPEASNAHLSCLWDLLPFVSHFHPSVSLFATSLLFNRPIPAKPDPEHYTLMHFLDRFVYRNAKSAKNADGTKGSISIMQPLAGSNALDKLIHRGMSATRVEGPLNNADFWQRKVEDIPVDQVFFHQYFNQSRKTASRQEKRRKAGEDGEEEDMDVEIDDDIASDQDLEEEEVWDALVKSKPDVDPENDGVDEGFDEDELEGYDDDDDDDVDVDDDGAEAGDDGEALDGLDLDDGSDAMIGSDDDVEIDLASDADEGGVEVEVETSGTAKQARVDDRKADRKSKKRKLKNLPTFASAEDYEKLLNGDQDGLDE